MALAIEERGTASRTLSGRAPKRGRAAFLVTAILVIHVTLLGWVATSNSPVLDEVGHIAAGVYFWHVQRSDLYRVNPPLVRAVATVPVVLANPAVNWRQYRSGPSIRPEWDLGIDFTRVNGCQKAFWYFTLARWACIPFSIIGGLVCYCWARELYGAVSGLVALSLWCFCPNVIAWGTTICPDVPAAAMGSLAGYAFWRWLKSPTWHRAMVAGAAMGIAELTKTTWVLLFGLWPLLWLTWAWSHRDARGQRLRQAGQLGLILLTCLYLLNLGYGFVGTFRSLGDYTFISHTLGGDQCQDLSTIGGNCFKDSWLGLVPLPLPEDYVTGIDLQKADFEAGKSSYLFGEWKDSGWWYYYFVCALFKVPLGTWLLGLLAAGVSLWRPRKELPTSPDVPTDYSAGRWNELVLLLPAVAVIALVSSQTGFSRYFRYVLPAFPFLYIWLSKVGRCIPLGHTRLTLVAAAALVWSVSSTLSIYPHCMSYFNELAGGPTGGHRFLLDANIDWGQDLFYLKRWLYEHPEAIPLRIDHKSLLTPDLLGMERTAVPVRINVERDRDGTSDAERRGLEPGWYALSIDIIHRNMAKYGVFLSMRPVAMAGYSIYIYRITPEDAWLLHSETGECREEDRLRGPKDSVSATSPNSK